MFIDHNYKSKTHWYMDIITRLPCTHLLIQP